MEFKVNSWMLEAAECDFEGNSDRGSRADSLTLIEMPAHAARCRFILRSFGSFPAGDPGVDLGFQHIERQRTLVQHRVMKSPQIELRS